MHFKREMLAGGMGARCLGDRPREATGHRGQGDRLERWSHEFRVILFGHDLGRQSPKLFEGLLLAAWYVGHE